jgi:site-specific recombinase XerD
VGNEDHHPSREMSPYTRAARAQTNKGANCALRFKHSLASHLIAGNVNLALVKQALGHRSISSTMLYIGTTDAQAAEAVQAALMGVY